MPLNMGYYIFAQTHRKCVCVPVMSFCNFQPGSYLAIEVSTCSVFQFDFMNCFMSLFYVAFYMQDIALLRKVTLAMTYYRQNVQCTE